MNLIAKLLFIALAGYGTPAIIVLSEREPSVNGKEVEKIVKLM